MGTREKILEAAKAQFAKKGFHGTLMSDIAESAGVGKGTIYRYFPSKEELFGSIINSQLESFENRIKFAANSGNSEIDVLTDIAKIHFEEYRASKEVIEILVMEGLNKIGDIKQDFKNGIVKIEEIVSQVISKGIDNGVFRGVDPKRTAVIFLGLIWTVLKHGIVMEERELEKKYFDTIFDIIFYGLLCGDYK